MQNPIDAYKQNRPSGKRKVFFFGVAAVIAATGLSFGLSDLTLQNIGSPQSKTEQNKYVEFTAEVYNKIQKNYWENISDKKLSELFEKGIEKIEKSSTKLSSKDLAGVKKAVAEEIKNIKKDKKKVEFVTGLCDMVLKSLPPQGRSRLYGQKKKKELANRVNNVNPQKNLYANLGLEKGASKEDVEKAAEKKEGELNKKIEEAKTEEEKQKVKDELKDVKYSKEVLSEEESKNKYDTTGAEPTVFKKRLTNDIIHIYIKKFSPTTLQELKKAADSVDMSKYKPTSLILDLRQNVGGSIDLAPYILGPFIGKDNYAYEAYQQGDKNPVKTKVGWMNSLVPYKKVVILADKQTQSTGEVFVSTLKKFNVGVFIGETTRGWGTIEKIFMLNTQIDPNNKYGIFLVHHLTLRADGKPIQGRGVNPIIDITSKNWKDKLNKYFNAPQLIEKVEEIWNSEVPRK